MCGRYVVVSQLKKIAKRFNVSVDKAIEEIYNTNVSPGDFSYVITDDKPDEIQAFQFGLTPLWAKKKMYVFNARSEGDHNKENDVNYKGAKGIINKPMFRNLIRSKRCLVIADAFIEGPEKEKLSEPFVIYNRHGDRPFALAGLWDSWTNKETGEVLYSFSIITTVANDLLQKVGHHRSPVLLSEADEKTWLDKEAALDDITALLQPFDPSDYNAYSISTDIKNPRNNGGDLLKPLAEPLYPEFDYTVYQAIKLEGMGASRARKRKTEQEQEKPKPGGQGSLFD